VFLFFGGLTVNTSFHRRDLLLGSSALAVASAVPTNAQALAPAVLGAVRVLTTVWAGVKMAAELYNKTFPEPQRQVIIRERERIIIQNNYIFVPEYYAFENPYRFPEFRQRHPGFICGVEQGYDFQALACQGTDEAIFLPPGMIAGLQTAMAEMNTKYARDDERICGYTRPARYWQPTTRWASDGLGAASEMSYYSPRGSVALKWVIPDRTRRVAFGSYRVGDRNSSVLVEGRTARYAF
jgi:hypothetical protein